MTSLLLNDEIHNDHINPYTATGTFGVSYNGGYKYPAPEVDVPEEENVPADTGVPVSHFNPLTIDRSGNKYLKTLSSANYAKSFLYPARKFQFDNGSTTFGREVAVASAENYIVPEDFGPSDATVFKYLVIISATVLVLLLAFQKS
jgi:hypothetical protein